MLDESLENFLEATLTGEQYKLYVDIISYLESIEYDTIQAELLNLAFMSIGDENEKQPKPESTICDEMHGHLFQVLMSQLSQNGIEVAEGSNLKDTFDLAVGVLHISGHEDLASVIATASNDDHPNDQLSDILQLVTTIPADHWTMIIDSVSPQLIQRIREMGTQVVNTEYQEMEETAEYLQKLRLYNEFIQKQDRNLKMFELAANTILGRELETYINSGIIDDLFEGNEMDKLAMELYGLCLMSSDAKNDPPAAIRAVVEKYLSDTTRIVRLNSEMGIVNAAYVKFFQTSSKGLTI